ncbi:MAG: ATPase, T2SS/T4P/T4SS family [Campylobacterota bacterium]|nr:ATPase, T2SS/T4P/T4SS family [Campylobacterota bacterium]
MIHYPIGEIFKEMGIVAQPQLDAALHVQKASNIKLGEILVKLNFVTVQELARAVALQKQLDYIDLETYVPQADALSLIDQEFVQLNALLPLYLENDTLHIATSNPDNDMSSYLQEMTGKAIRFVVSDALSIARCIQLYYEQLKDPIEVKIGSIIESAVEGNEIDIIELAELIIDNAIKDRATDIHIMPELVSSHIFYRVDGVMQHYYSLPNKLHHILISRLKVLGKLDIIENFKAQSGEFHFNFLQTDYNIRISTIPTMKGEKIALRLLPENFSLYSLEDLGFEPELVTKLESYLKKSSGMILIIGPSGNGKTTTLYALLRKINILERNVLSIEEPVEFQLPFVSQLQVNLKTGFTFSKGLRHIARQDPDVIVIGEILDEETAQLAVRSSLTGHLILSTTFGNRPSSLLTRLKDFHVDRHTLSDGLIAIISQKLIRRLCPHCKEPIEISKEKLAGKFATSSVQYLPHDTFTIYRPGGCIHCKNSGYLGRMALAELFEIDDKIRKMIDSDQNSLELDLYAKEQMMKELVDDALLKVINGDTSLEEVQRI